MAALNTEQKTFVIKRFACFDSLADIRDALKETYGLEVDTRQLMAYNPESAVYAASKKWRIIYDNERAAFLTNVESIGIAQKSVRIQRLERMCQLAMQRKNIVLAASLMEQAAKEMGEVFTNKRVVDSRSVVSTENMSTDELRSEILSDMSRLGISQGLLPGPSKVEEE